MAMGMKTRAAGMPRMTMVASSMKDASMRLRPAFQAGGQFLVDAVESTVRQDGNHIASAKLRHDLCKDGFHVSAKYCRSAFGIECTDYIVGMQTFLFGDTLLLVNAGKHHAISEAEAVDQFAFEHFAAERIGPRLEHRPEARRRIYSAQRAKRFAD